MNINSIAQNYVIWSDIENDFNKNIDFSHISISSLMSHLESSAVLNEVQNVDLINYVFKFYGYNEYFADLKKRTHGFVEKEDTEILKNYNDFLNDFSKKILCYIVCCSFAEAVHSNFLIDKDDYEEIMVDSFISSLVKNKDSTEYKTYLKHHANGTPSNRDYREYLEDIYSNEYDLPKQYIREYKIKENETFSHLTQKTVKKFKSYTKDLPNGEQFEKLIQFINVLSFDTANYGVIGDDGDLQRYLIKNKTFQNSELKDVPIKDVLSYLSKFFLKGFSSGFGGKVWHDITQHALSFVQGEINAEMFLDRSLSLEHNSGNIFNKNFIFESSENVSNYTLNWFNGNPKNYSSSLKVSELGMILNLQNSSSVFAFLDQPNLSKLVDLDFNQAIYEYILQNTKNKQYDLTPSNIHLLVTNISQQAVCFLEFNQKIKDYNKKFIQQLDTKNFKPASFNFSDFLIAHYTSHRYGDISSTLNEIENTRKINNIFSELLTKESFVKVISKDSYFKSKPLKTSKPKKKDSIFQIYNLNDVRSNDLTKEDIGGKAKGLVDLISLGFNVPKAIVFDTKTCLSYLSSPDYFQEQFKKHSPLLTNYLTDIDGSPILVSVRSGASISMPGMMDSILNIGIDDTTYDLLVSKYSKVMIDDCAIHFMKQFCSSKLNVHIDFPKKLSLALEKFRQTLIKHKIIFNKKTLFPLNIEQQIKYSVEAVFNSWNSPRAISWRKEKNISHQLGTSATIQKMVFGNKNKNSFTSVIFSSDCITGNSDLMGEYLEQAQGEDLVSGKKTPKKIQELKIHYPAIYKEIFTIAKKLEHEYKAIQDIEITVEDNQVYVLQKRNAVVSPQAQIVFSQKFGLPLSENIHIDSILKTLKVDTNQPSDYKGLSACPGIISGIVVRTLKDIEKFKKLNKPLIFLSEQALPEHAPLMIQTHAFVTHLGGATSHAAILSRSMNKPCIVGLGKTNIKAGDAITLDANTGHVWKNEYPIIAEDKLANKLANKILKEKNIVLKNKVLPFHKVNINSWFTPLSLKTKKKSKVEFTKFLSLSQQAAVILLKEEDKKKITFKG